MKETINSISKVSIFKDLDESELQFLISISTLKSFKTGNVLFYKGSAPDYLHVLLDGNLKIYKHNPKGNELILKTFNEISLIAELANFEQINYPSNCVAISDSKVLLIDYKKFEEYFLNNPKFLLQFIKSLTKKVMNLEDVISTNLTLDATAKVAKYIYENEHDFLDNSHSKSASLLNTTPETFSRIIRKFKNENILLNDTNKLRVNDKHKLKEYFLS